MEKAYICSPLAGNKKENINNAIAYAKFVYHRCGMIPIMSHFYALIFDDTDKIQRKLGISIDLGRFLTLNIYGYSETQSVMEWVTKSEKRWL